MLVNRQPLSERHTPPSSAQSSPRVAHEKRGAKPPYGEALSQQQLAEAMEVSRQTINSIEKERYTPSLPLAIAFARYFDKPVEEVFHADT